MGPPHGHARAPRTWIAPLLCEHWLTRRTHLPSNSASVPRDWTQGDKSARIKLLEKRTATIGESKRGKSYRHEPWGHGRQVALRNSAPAHSIALQRGGQGRVVRSSLAALSCVAVARAFCRAPRLSPLLRPRHSSRPGSGRGRWFRRRWLPRAAHAQPARGPLGVAA